MLLYSSLTAWGFTAYAFVFLAKPAVADVFSDPDVSGQQWIFDTINIAGVWEQGIFGKGVRVRVNDQGVDSSHDEFFGRFDVGGSCGLYEAPYDEEKQEFYQHGTKVASILGAGGNNDGCSVGVAPGVTLSSCVSTTTPNTDETAQDGTWLSHKLDDMDISNNSYGTIPCISAETFTISDMFEDVDECPFADRPEEYIYRGEEMSFDHPCNVCTFPSDSISDSCAMAIYDHCSLYYEWDRDTCINLLDGLTRSGQCSFLSEDETIVRSLERGAERGRDGKGIIYVFSSGNNLAFGSDTNLSARWQSRFIIYVGSVGRDGLHTQYSTPGASLFVVAPIGDRDDPLTIVTARAGGGCQTTGSGTSFSAPIVSGVIALMLDANPRLSWRDVQGIIATTSRSVTHSIYDDESQVVNDAGLRHSHLYGFGIVDALAAVTAAQNWESYGDEVVVTERSNVIDLTIGDNPDDPTFAQLSIADRGNSNFLVENVEVYVYLRHLSRGHLKITLTSPRGTVSELTPGSRPENGQDGQPWILRTVRSWGESAEGTWSLSVADTKEGDVSSCVDIFDWQVEGSYYTHDCNLIERIPDLHDQEEADWLRFLFTDKEIMDACCVCGGGNGSGSGCADEDGADETCSEVEFWKVCSNGSLGDYYERFDLKDNQGRTVWDACCIAGGGNVYSDPDSFRDRLVRWELRVYGHEEAIPTQPPTRQPTPNPTRQPIPRPVSEPTRGPTRPPTRSPTNPPVGTPTTSPTDRPSGQAAQPSSNLPCVSESSSLPFGLCFGDCDTDMECQDGLICFQRNSFESVPGCSCGETRESLTDFCISAPEPEVTETNDLPLALCHGDCDTSLDCQPGLVCYQRNAFDPVPGCSGGEDVSSSTDFCVKDVYAKDPTGTPTDSPSKQPTRLPSKPPIGTPTRSPSKPPIGTPTTDPTTRPSGQADQPSSDLPCVSESFNFPLQRCFGDCDTDMECQDGLVCFQRDSFESVPGCSCGESVESLTDYCVFPPGPQEVDETNDFPLGLCEGECDTDFDCSDGLVCYQRNAYEQVPGCLGGEDDSSNSDFCIKEVLFVVPVPIGSPSGSDPGVTLQQTEPPTPSVTVSLPVNAADSSSAKAKMLCVWGTMLAIICAFVVV
ncbi:unnamed protein product [Cylindrotheca closterium]|uniref:subtilisin n=1 Tax=Cylindrotheca closterium TaxID=2856 RepID=A0AAD2G3Y5_9STRA|nr:unnamed protein product [Cylindrotheca closterium]